MGYKLNQVNSQNSFFYYYLILTIKSIHQLFEGQHEKKKTNKFN